MTDRSLLSQDVGVATPSDADVLAGRGNACNFHPGNEYFRALVRKHKVAYVACPKPQKGKYSRIIVDEIYIRGGRFLKQNTTDKLWYDIGDKKALDKTRQALREGAPELLKEIKPEEPYLVTSGQIVSNGGVEGVPNGRFAAGIVQQPPPPAPMHTVSMHTPSCTPVIQNRRRIDPGEASTSTTVAPSLTSLPAHLVANAHRQTSQDMEALHKKLAALYSPEQFEPTPINPNHQLSMQENSRLEDSPKQQQPKTRHERSDSLELDKIFNEKSPKLPQKSGSNMDDLSQQLSNMSFSVGDIAAIQDEGNLSSLFEDSMKLKEKSSSSTESNNNNNNRRGSNGKQQTRLSLSSFGGGGIQDMSMSTFGGDSIGNMQMSTQSFSHVFEESTTDKV
jgi:hypothetical protein